MTETHRIGDEPLSDFLERIDWSYVKKVAITKTVDGIFWAELTHYRSGKYMLHAFKHGRKEDPEKEAAPVGDA
jgi:hypothetical protein